VENIPLCRASGAQLEEVLNLGRQPLGNGFIDPANRQPEYFFDLKVGFSEEGSLLQLIDQPAAELMFHDDYAFFSGTSAYMRRHFEELADEFIDEHLVENQNPFVVELGCNDGVLLRHFAARGIRHLGVEPAGAVGDAAVDAGVSVLREFFSSSVAEAIKNEHGRASIVTSSNVMCHIADIMGTAQGIADLLDQDGVLIFEDPYLGDIIRLNSYDQIYDEHVFLFSAMSVQKLFARVGLELLDARPQSTHGGSMRYYLAHTGKRKRTEHLGVIIKNETEMGLNRAETYHSFAARVARSAESLRTVMSEAVSRGRTIAAYGATSKSTTIYNYARIGPELISYVVDNTPVKIGKLTPGMHIPIFSEAKFRDSPPDLAFLSAWNHSKEIQANNLSFSELGGHWITHVPEVRVIL